MAQPHGFIDADIMRVIGEHWLACCRDRISATGVFSVALSGGGTPQELYRRLSSPPLSGQVNWQDVCLFLGDERDLPVDHPDSNWGMIRRTLLDRLPFTPGRAVGPEAGTGDPEAAAARYQALLMSQLSHHDGPPVLDLVLLGMGEDGHIASLIPGTSAMEETDLFYVANPVPETGMTRLTLTFPVLRAARAVWILVTGEHKAERLADVFTNAASTAPAARIARADNVTWYLDDAAASKLPPMEGA